MIKPTGDKVLIKLEEAKETLQGGIYVPDSMTRPGSSQIGIVVALGSGRDQNGNMVDFEIKIGDTVLVGPYGISEIKLEKEKYMLIKYEDILGIIE